MSDKTVSHSHTNNPHVVLFQKLHISFNSGGSGTLTRQGEEPHNLPTSDPTLQISVLSKDVTFNQSNTNYVRIFLPRKALGNNNKKLPLIIYFHGGGFIVLSAASKVYHDFCFNLSNHVEAVVLSVEYRLAPEHRLPAAYDDAVEALQWIKTHPDEWLRRYADYSNCYLMGGSAGANIAYFAGPRAAAQVDHLEPLKIKGLILHQPFFGGTRRSGSELRHVNDQILPLTVSDLMWELSLPIGADRDHEFCNQTAGDGHKQLGEIKRLGWRVLVIGCCGDPLVDRQRELTKLMEERGVQVVGHFEEGNYHGFEIFEPLKSKPLLELVKKFIFSMPTKEIGSSSKLLNKSKSL